jgi:uncharacterized beta-barrel protein YwiB (DUF1934 family)
MTCRVCQKIEKNEKQNNEIKMAVTGLYYEKNHKNYISVPH